MKTVSIKLDSVSKIKQFCNIISAIREDVDLGEGRYIVDAKSIMGIFSLNLSKPVVMTIHTQNIDRFDEIVNLVSEFVV